MSAWGRATGAVCLGLMSASGLGLLLRALLAGIHPLWGVREVLLGWSPGPYALRHNPWYLLVPVSAMVLACVLLAYLVRQETTRKALPLAFLSLWALVVPALSWALPGGSYVFQWPWILALIAAVLAPRRPVALVPAFLALVFLVGVLVPTLGSALGLDWPLAAVLPLWLFLAVGLLWAPVADLAKGRLLLPLAAVLLLLGLTAGGYWARTTFRNRNFANIVYMVNLDRGRAWWVAERKHDGAWTRSFLNQPLPGEPSWEGDGRIRPGSEGLLRHQEAPMLAVPQPALDLRSDRLEAGVRTLRVTLTSAGAEELVLEGGGANLLSATVAGHPLILRGRVQSGGSVKVAAGESTRAWRLSLLAPPAEGGVEVMLAFAPDGQPPAIGLQARFGGLPAALGERAKPLPGVRPIELGNRTLVGRVLELK